MGLKLAYQNAKNYRWNFFDIYVFKKVAGDKILKLIISLLINSRKNEKIIKKIKIIIWTLILKR